MVEDKIRRIAEVKWFRNRCVIYGEDVGGSKSVEYKCCLPKSSCQSRQRNTFTDIHAQQAICCGNLHLVRALGNNAQ